jgi:hypothetical protein
LALHLEALPAHAEPARADGSDPAIAYRLVETWAAPPRPAAPSPGAFDALADLVVAPDGAIYALDSAQGMLHVLEADGQPRRLIRLLDEGDRDRWVGMRVDLGPDGSIHLLSATLPFGGQEQRVRIDRFDSAEGRRIGRIQLRAVRPYPFRDLAVGPDGRIYLSRVQPVGPLDAPGALPEQAQTAVEVRAPDGRLLASLTPPSLGRPGNLDVDGDGRIYVINRVQPNLNLPGGNDPRPAAESPESDAPGANQPGSNAPDSDAPDSDAPAEGLLVFDSSGALERFEPFNAAVDVAAGPAGVFVSRDVEVYALGEDEPLYTAPIGNPKAGVGERISLALTPAGGMVLGLSHCYAQRLLFIDAPYHRPAEARPAPAPDPLTRAAPAYPIAIDADLDLALLQGRSDREPGLEGRLGRLRAFDRGQIPQQAERWELGRPQSSQGLCAGTGPWTASDLAVDGEWLYTLDAAGLQQFAADAFPRWTRRPLPADLLGPPRRLSRISAAAGRLALLDQARGEVLILDAEGRERATWPTAGAGEAESVFPVDLALGEGRVYLADRRARRIRVHDLDGRPLESWSVHFPPTRIALGPAGEVFVLDDAGWVLRYSAEGALESAWSLPDWQAGAHDLAVDRRGKVYVSFALLDLEIADPAWSLRMPSHPIRAAGLWLFEPAPGSGAGWPEGPPRAGRCILAASAEASPARALVGGRSHLRLGLEGRCPGQRRPIDLLLLLDLSRSMGFLDSLDRARAAAYEILGSLDAADRIGLIGFNDRAHPLLPLGSPPVQLSRALADAQPEGGTDLGAGLRAAIEALGEANGPSGRERRVVLLTDGAFERPAEAETARLRSAGIELSALVFVNESFDAPSQLKPLERLAGESERLVFSPRSLQLQALAQDLDSFESAPEWLGSGRIEAPVPENLAYLDGSAAPPAEQAFDPARLVWNLENQQGAIHLDFDALARKSGRWPESARAHLRYVDAGGESLSLAFPLPGLEVVAPAGRLWLPWTGRP